MGCIQSKNDLSDLNPNVYRVVNIDADGVPRWSGQLEITAREITLYRKGKDPIKWSLQHLRRYGFDADVFTFEAGRRCETGEGIYAFKCQHAQSLFHLLQAYIQGNAGIDDRGMDGLTGNTILNGSAGGMTQLRAGAHIRNSSGPINQLQNRSVNYVFPNNRGQSLSPNGTIHSSNPSRSTDTLSAEGNYLEPTPVRSNMGARYASGMRLSSVGSGPLSPEPNSPGSPNSFTNILEMAHLNQQPQYQNSNVYQEFPLRSGENNNNLLSKKLSLDIPPQEPAPIVATGQTTSSRQAVVASDAPVSPGEPDASHMYVNVTPGELEEMNAGTPTIVTTTQCSFGLQRLVSTTSIDPSTRCYENLDPADFRSLLGARPRYSKPDIFAKTDSVPMGCDKSEPATPTIAKQQQQQQQQTRVVNYIVLDLDQSPSSSSLAASSATPTSTATTVTSAAGPNSSNNSGITKSVSNTSGISQQNVVLPQQPITCASSVCNPNNNINTNKIATPMLTSGNSLLPPESPKKASSGYATIDFNKTVALSNTTAPSSDIDNEGSRKTRHSSTAQQRQTNSVSD